MKSTNNWIIFTILYALFVAFFESAKKKAVERNSIYEVLANFSLIAFLLTFFITKDAFKIDYSYLTLIFFKASIIVIAWILGVKVLEKMQISLYSMIKISRIIFSVLLSYLFLGEKITFITLIGMSIIILGLILVNKTVNKEERKEKSIKLVILLLISCLLNSISAIIDKKFLLHITSGQLQFWLLLFLTMYYWVILLIKKEKINYKEIKKNYWIPVVAIALVVGDRFLFIANENVDSQVIIMTMLKQLSVIMSIMLGKIIFKEKEITKKLLYSMLIIGGIGIMFIP